MMTAW
jgi:Sortilin, neurotensin receptor 3,